MVAHEFGGPWTEVKLAAVEYYLKCYTKALRRVPFDLWYIDAFAGTGARQVERAGGMFGSDVETLDGSARRALKVDPQFQHFVFIEADANRCAALEGVKGEHPAADVRVLRGNANNVLAEISSQSPWTLGEKSPSRGVVFLDPYALQVDWETLARLARTRLFDVWYLFPLRDVCRQLAKKKSGVGPKEPRMDRVLGPEWRDLYSLPPPAAPPTMVDLFGAAEVAEDPEEEELRQVDSTGVEAWFKRRLETEFAFVSEPLPLLTRPGRQTFSLFLAVSNPSKPAVEPAEKFVKYVERNYGPLASHRT